MTLNTSRLLLRPWALSDAESLFEYAKDPSIGPIAGWPAHKSIEESRSVIENVLNGAEAYALCLSKGESIPVGFCGLISAHTASKSLKIRQVFSADFFLSGQKSAPQKLLCA